MNIVRMAGTSPDNLFCVVALDDWALGNPEGLAHWDGVCWKWIERLNESYTSAMKCHRDQLAILDADGTIRMYASGILTTISRPSGIDPSVDFRDFALISDDTLVVAGNSGSFFLVQDTSWKCIETNTRSGFYSVAGLLPRIYLCGADGTLIWYDGNACITLQSKTTDTFLCLDEGFDGSVFVVAAGQQSGLYRINCDDLQFLRAGPSTIHAIAAVTETEVYCSTTANGLVKWDGSKFDPCLGSNVAIGQIVKIGRHIIASNWNERVSSVFIDPPFWRKIDMNLEESFLK